MRGAYGTVCRLTIDINHTPGPPALFDYLVSEAGSWYAVDDAHHVRSSRHPNRWRFTVTRVPPPDLDATSAILVLPRPPLTLARPSNGR